MRKFLNRIIPDPVAVLLKKVMFFLYRKSEKAFTGPFDKYDYQTILAAKRVLTRESGWIDVGAHKGHILRELLSLAPGGPSYAFEPIPYLYQKLQKKYGKKVKIFDCVLSDTEGEARFTHVIDRPAISGMVKRTIVDGNYNVEEITVPMKQLDNMIPAGQKIDLLKIDVEGAEVKVLRGAKQLLATSQPAILFECGSEGGEIYNTTAEELYELLAGLGYSISILEYFLKNMPPFNRAEFLGQYEKGYNYFFIAYVPEKLRQ